MQPDGPDQAAGLRAPTLGHRDGDPPPRTCCPTPTRMFEGENPQHVYTVGFASTELWGPDAEPFTLHVDLFESYLEPDPVSDRQ